MKFRKDNSDLRKMILKKPLTCDYTFRKLCEKNLMRIEELVNHEEMVVVLINQIQDYVRNQNDIEPFALNVEEYLWHIIQETEEEFLNSSGGSMLSTSESSSSSSLSVNFVSNAASSSVDGNGVSPSELADSIEYVLYQRLQFVPRNRSALEMIKLIAAVGVAMEIRNWGFKL